MRHESSLLVTGRVVVFGTTTIVSEVSSGDGDVISTKQVQELVMLLIDHASDSCVL